MNNIIDNPCIRCGKQRITISTYEEHVGVSLITVTNTSCPDPECQKLVERTLADEKLRRESFANNPRGNPSWIKRRQDSK